MPISLKAFRLLLDKRGVRVILEYKPYYLTLMGCAVFALIASLDANFGSSNNNQIMIIGAIALAALFLFKKWLSFAAWVQSKESGGRRGRSLILTI